ncbi:EscU/YscU/HrcU family type III secretion system export apparatus switch protein [Effusibacillus pohliae]|uniref:EscU/YscU/HrcU family type III secretion system export apparatus switch protein n=1 Tax=Effusibacillus pohliae TaxID=232270 RepID=UPI0003797319|nr:EscU/YscU/HrcU family type III secretion system export apparatus switch protein [Effusibacillus pohliae]
MQRNQPKKAAALAYDPAVDQAPKIVASGQGEIGQRIIELANEHGVPVHQDPVLVETLLAFDVGREIPPELYQAVAEILAFVQHLERKAAGKTENVP